MSIRDTISEYRTIRFQKFKILFGWPSNISESSENSCSNQYIRDHNHTLSLQYYTRRIWDNTYPFWTCHPSGNLVDGLPLAIHSGRAPIHKFRCKILDYTYIYRIIVRVNPRDSVLPHSNASELASERSKRPDHGRVLLGSIFRICWTFLLRI